MSSEGLGNIQNHIQSMILSLSVWLQKKSASFLNITTLNKKNISIVSDHFTVNGRRVICWICSFVVTNCSIPFYFVSEIWEVNSRVYSKVVLGSKDGFPLIAV